MTKRFVQDVVPGGRRSIRNIPLPNSKSEPIAIRKILLDEKPKKKVREEAVQETTQPKKNLKQGSRFSFGRWAVWTGAVVGVLVLIYAASFLFVSATVTILPRTQAVPVALAGSATLEPVSSGLGFTVVNLSRENSKVVPATGEQNVENKAFGQVFIYNSYSADVQTLVANTRFQASNGLIFRIKDSVTIPGQKTVNGIVTPGSISVILYADQAGPKYNIGLADFTIPGFKGDPKFDKVIAKSDPKSMIAGGFVGTIKRVSKEDAVAAKVSIETQLKKELQDTLNTQIPASHILFKNASTFAFTELPQEATANATTATVREKGSIYGILFDKNQLSQFLANQLIQGNNKDVYISNFDSLMFTLDNTASFDPIQTKAITFKLSGNVTFVWNVDQAKVSESLAGQKKANVKDILVNFDSIDRANVSIKPIWIFSLPNKPSKIQVVLENHV